MRGTLAAMATLWAVSATPAEAAEGLVVWMEPTVPSEKATSKAANMAGELDHVAHADLAFPPQPVSDADAQRYSALRDAVASSRSKWEEFEVEYGIATDLEAALDAIDITRDVRDVDALIEARALQGAAVHRAFDPQDFQEGERARVFRFTPPGTAHLNRPWVVAVALDPDHKLGQDVAESATFPDLQKLQEELRGLADATLDASALPPGTELVVDAVPTDGSAAIALRPGEHYVHVVRNGVVAGRSVLEVLPGDTVTLPMLVSPDELQAARTQVIAGATTGFPEDVKTALDAIAGRHGGPVFIGAVDDGKVVLLPYARGAQLLKQRIVTVVATGDIGAQVLVSPLFDESGGELITAPGAGGSLGVEIGIFNAVLLGGCDLAFTPGHTITYGNKDLTDNVATSAMPQPWGGFGLYALRPIGDAPTLLLAGTYGFNAPAHMAIGARATLGIPIDEGGTWIRITLGGSSASDVREDWKAVYPAETPMHTLFLRVGFGALF